MSNLNPETESAPGPRRSTDSCAPRIAILGAGAAGLCMAIQLLEHGISSFTIFEKSDGVGGTWRDNTYPGAACDVPSHLYSFSFAPKTDWSRKFPEQPEILDYFESLVDRFGLAPHLRFDTEVDGLAWDDGRSLWHLESRSSGVVDPAEFDVVVSGLGQLNQPNIPEIEGLSDFRGTTFHSARWNHEHDLRGERVAVIGIGASAIQFVPQVSKAARQLTLFQRSVNYVVPKPDREFRAWEHWLLENIPSLRRLYRESIYWRFEARFSLMRKNSRLGRFVKRAFANQVAKIASPELPEASLVPDYSPGCRRLLIANDWYPTLRKPSTTVVTDGVTRVTTDGVVTETGAEYPVDTIIFGTGFRATDFLAPLNITGRHGRDLNDEWSQGARALLGVAVPGFPNLFILYGPNTNLGHNSILFMIEQQVGYIIQLIATIAEGSVSAAEVTPEAMDRFDVEMATALAKTVWDEDCSSWYKNEAGRVVNNWPDYTVNYRRRMRHPDLTDWSLSRPG